MAEVTAWNVPVGRTAAEPRRTVYEHGLDNGRLRVAVWSYGATLVEASVRDGERRTNLVVRLPDLATYEERAGRAYVGSTMGRYARIVARGEAPVAGRVHQLALNEGDHHIHGGPRGFDAVVWEGHARGGPDSGSIVLSLYSPDGDQGYPGTLRCTATFALGTDDTLTVRYEATTDRPTLCGLTLHAFWNLAGGGTVDDHVLDVGARAVLEADAHFVPTGRLLPVADTPLGHVRDRPLSGVALDHFAALAPASPAAVLRHPAGGRTLRLSTTEPGLAVYSGDHLPVPRAGLCLQPGAWPDAPHHPSFPSALLYPGRTYRHVTTYTFGREHSRAGH
ncbi:aldose epimerase family protein [Streptomyces avermitilis]|uniref:aldose epimerase family protein n=1 Tax=Streptomyces avermitilis TaxID=33903 RepID=UPI0033AB12FE